MYDSTHPDTTPLQPTSTTVLWEATSEDLTHLATGGRLQSAAYRLTEDGLHFEAGTLSRTAEVIPLWVVVDVDLKQSLAQRVRGVSDLVVKIDPNADYHGQRFVILRFIKEAERVRDLIIRQANQVRLQMSEYRHQRRIKEQQAGASSVNVGVVPGMGADAAAPSASAGTTDGSDDLLARLERLAALHHAGALSDDEFATAKAKLLA